MYLCYVLVCACMYVCMYVYVCMLYYKKLILWVGLAVNLSGHHSSHPGHDTLVKSEEIVIVKRRK